MEGIYLDYHKDYESVDGKAGIMYVTTSDKGVETIERWNPKLVDYLAKDWEYVPTGYLYKAGP